jgi:hypothetical protein
MQTSSGPAHFLGFKKIPEFLFSFKPLFDMLFGITFAGIGCKFGWKMEIHQPHQNPIPNPLAFFITSE